MQITSAVCRADPAKFVSARHAKIAKSVATHSIEYSIYEARQQKKLTDFFHQREREPQFIRGEQIGIVYMEKEIKRFLL